MVPEARRVRRADHRENLAMGAYVRNDRAEIQDDVERVRAFPAPRERRRQTAGTLSGGEQQMLAMGRALMSSRSCCCSTSPRWGWRR
jgi:branched-chain amino acid transport system ATP-binding protein